MAKAIELRTSSGSSVERQWAKSESGNWFSRIRRKDLRYGWSWSRWELSSNPPAPGLLTQEHLDHGTMPYGSDPRPGHERLRLPA